MLSAALTGARGAFGPIPADQARAIAADATWRRLLTDPAELGTTAHHDPSGAIVHTTRTGHHHRSHEPGEDAPQPVRPSGGGATPRPSRGQGDPPF